MSLIVTLKDTDKAERRAPRKPRSTIAANQSCDSVFKSVRVSKSAAFILAFPLPPLCLDNYGRFKR
jgi:hypothetical protein